jgi:hypothetical protein
MQTILSCPANLRGRTIILVFKFGKTPPRFKTLPFAKKSGLQKNGPVQKAINRRDKGVFAVGHLGFTLIFRPLWFSAVCLSKLCG